jgi:hypothetical protein
VTGRRYTFDHEGPWPRHSGFKIHRNRGGKRRFGARSKTGTEKVDIHTDESSAVWYANIPEIYHDEILDNVDVRLVTRRTGWLGEKRCDFRARENKPRPSSLAHIVILGDNNHFKGGPVKMQLDCRRRSSPRMSKDMLVVGGGIKPCRVYWADDDTVPPTWAYLNLRLQISERTSDATSLLAEEFEEAAREWFEQAVELATMHPYLRFADGVDAGAVLVVGGHLDPDAFDGGVIKDGPVAADVMVYGGPTRAATRGETAALLATAVFVHDRFWDHPHEDTLRLAQARLRSVDPPYEFEEGYFDGLDADDAVDLLVEVTLNQWLDAATRLAATSVPERVRGLMHVEHANAGIQLQAPSGWVRVTSG